MTKNHSDMSRPDNLDGPGPDLNLKQGEMIGHYQIVERIGAGGMGEVYRAEDTSLKRTVALKFLIPQFARNPDYRNRFLQEARAAARLNHPNIVAVHEVGEYKGIPYCVMAFIDGRSLDDHESDRVIPVSRIVEYGLQIAEGLTAAHVSGITHRDLKPGNILVASTGGVFIADFGLAVVADADKGDNADATVTRLTSTGALAGTVPYMAPEQLQGGPVTPQVDIFALGVVLYELTCGVHPFAATGPAETAAGILRDNPKPVAERRPETPYDLARIIGRCLRKEPSRRFQTAQDVRNELLDLQEVSKSGEDHPEGGSARAASEGRAVDRGFVLTAEIVRKLSVRSSKVIGDRLTYYDNEVDSDILVVFLPPWGLDRPHSVRFVKSLPYRGIVPTLYGFENNPRNRLPLTLEDQSILLRELFADMSDRVRPRHVILMGRSASADHVLHLVTSDVDTGLPVSGVISFGCNVDLESCFLSSRFANMQHDTPDELFNEIKGIGSRLGTLDEWLKFHEYMIETFSRFRTNADPLRAFARDIVEPFRQHGWKQFASWYRTVIERVPHVRFVIDQDDHDKIDYILDRHLEENVLGDNFSEDSIIKEDVPHIGLGSVEMMLDYVEDVVSRIRQQQ